MERYTKVTIEIDIMLINRIPFVMTTSRIKIFGTAKNRTIMATIEQIVKHIKAKDSG